MDQDVITNRLFVISKERHANLSQFKQVSWTLLQLINNTERRWRAGHAYFF